MERMTLKKTVESLAQNAVSTAVTAVRNPRDTAARAGDLVKGTAGAGVGLVRNRIGHAPSQAPAPDRERVDAQKNLEDTVAKVKEAVTETTQDVVAKVEEVAPAANKSAAKKPPAAKKASPRSPRRRRLPPRRRPRPRRRRPRSRSPRRTPRDHIPGPDLATFEPPTPDELPEPIVIVAEDTPSS